MDGVLADSYQPHYESWVLTCKKRGLYIDELIYDRLFGQTFETFADSIAGDSLTRQERQEWYEEKEALYRNIVEHDFPEMDGVSDLICALDGAGYKLAIGSSGPKENVETAVRKLKAGACFDATVNGDDVSRGKPDPEVFLKAASKLGVCPGLCVVVEDSIHGLQAAINAGMRCIGITGTAERAELEEHADIVIDSMNELSVDTFDQLLLAGECTSGECEL